MGWPSARPDKEPGATAAVVAVVAGLAQSYDASMKTTLDIEPELYSAAERLARAQHQSLGEVVSALLRRALGLDAAPGDIASSELERRNGFEAFPERPGPQATVEGVQQICREEGLGCAPCST